VILTGVADAESMAERATVTDTVEEIPLAEKGPQKSDNGSDVANAPPLESKLEKEIEAPQHPIEGPWILPKNLWILLRHRAVPFVWKVLTHGSGVDIHALQAGKEGTKEGERMRKMYERATQYPNETEHLYSFMQVMTACTASFAHGYVHEYGSGSMSDVLTTVVPTT
jgi:sodium-dependent phosphate transporter